MAMICCLTASLHLVVAGVAQASSVVAAICPGERVVTVGQVVEEWDTRTGILVRPAKVLQARATTVHLAIPRAQAVEPGKLIRCHSHRIQNPTD
jgi:hypothetical protein